MAEPSNADRGDDVDPVAVFRVQLQEFRAQCGGPSYRVLELLCRKIGQPQSRTAIHEKLTGTTTPDWAFVKAFVEACAKHIGTGLDPGLPAWHDRHAQMKAARAVMQNEAAVTEKRRLQGLAADYLPQGSDLAEGIRRLPAEQQPRVQNVIARDHGHAFGVQNGNIIYHEAPPTAET